MTGKKKGNCLMRIIKFLFVFCLFVVIMVGMNTDTDKSKNTPDNTVSHKPQTTNAPTATLKLEKITPEPTKTIEELKALLKEAQNKETPTPKTSKETIEGIKSLLSNSMEGFSYYNVSGDETGFTMTVAMDGLAAEVAAAKASKEKSEGWADVRKVSVLMCNNASGMIKNFGMTNAVCALYVVNDINHDDVLLFVLDGQIVFDCMDMK